MTATAFALLTVSMVLLWTTRGTRVWMFPAAGAIAVALLAHLIDIEGLAIVAGFAAACEWARRAPHHATRVVLHAVVLAGCAVLFLHLAPGFDNPLLVKDVVLDLSALPYTKY